MESSRESYRFSFINHDGRDLKSRLHHRLSSRLNGLSSIKYYTRLEIKRVTPFLATSMYDSEDWAVMVDFIPSSIGNAASMVVRDLIEKVVKIECKNMNDQQYIAGGDPYSRSALGQESYNVNMMGTGTFSGTALVSGNTTISGANIPNVIKEKKAKSEDEAIVLLINK